MPEKEDLKFYLWDRQSSSLEWWQGRAILG